MAGPYSIRCRTGDYVEAPNSTLYDFERTEPFSILMWVRSASDGTIVSKQTNDATLRGYAVEISSGKVRFTLANDVGGGNYIRVDSVPSVNDDEWHQIVVTYNGDSDADRVLIFIDSIESSVSVIQNSLSATTVNTTTLRMSQQPGGGNSLDCLLGDVAIFDNDLLEEEIVESYNGGFPPDLLHFGAPSNLLTYWRGAIGVSSLPTIPDIGGSSVDATASSGITTRDLIDNSPGLLDPPTVQNFSPPNGSTIDNADPIFFDVTDPQVRFRRVIVVAQQADATELVHDGDAFVFPYNNPSSVRSSIAGGWTYRVSRETGWNDDVTITIFAIDLEGNENA